MARQSAVNITGKSSPADFLPPGLRDAETQIDETPAPEPLEPQVGKGAQNDIDPEVRQRMIREAAYQLYVQRGFVEGYEVEDWLQAEAEIDRKLT